MSNAKTHELQPDLAPKKSTLIKGVVQKDINGNLYIKTPNRYVYLMQDDQDYLRIQSIDIVNKEVEAYLSDVKITIGQESSRNNVGDKVEITYTSTNTRAKLKTIKI